MAVDMTIPTPLGTPPRILSIAGSDSSGGAGIQADIKTITMLGGYAMTAITAITAQNTVGVQGIAALAPEMVAQQIASCVDDIGVDAIKIGMLHDAAIIAAVAEALTDVEAPIVLDPVMIATSGAALIAPDAVAAMRDRLFPLATLITPNLPELAHLVGRPLTTTADMVEAAEELAEATGAAVLAKGGHMTGLSGAAGGWADYRRAVFPRHRHPRPARGAVRSRPDRHPPHPRHGLHAVVSDCHAARPRPTIGTRGQAGAAICDSRDRGRPRLWRR